MRYHYVSYRIIVTHNLATKNNEITKPGFSNRLGAKKRLLKGLAEHETHEEKLQKANEI
jgi:hypothetical protein